MESSQRNQRDDLDQAFSESLNQLEEILESEDSPTAASKPEPTPKRRQAQSIDLAALEDAAADIEAYMENKKGSS